MQRITAIILSSRGVGEFDRLYAMYSREAGLVRAVGRGVRRPAAKLAGHLEPLTLSEIHIARSRGRGQIASAITLENFENIKKSFENTSKILRIFRFFLKIFGEEEKDERTFDLLREFLENLDGLGYEGDRAGVLSEAFWWKIFDLLGRRPEVARCLKCSARPSGKEENFFSAEEGGIICGKCGRNGNGLSRITANQIKLLRIFLANTLPKILKVKIDSGELEGLVRIRKDFERYNF